MQDYSAEHISRNILVVDDDMLVLELVTAVLSRDGDNIITANGSAKGLQQSHDFPGEIQLLLSGFGLSGMSGIELAKAVTLERPKIKVLLMSGFPDGMLVLNEGWHFLPKPFVASQLRTLVTGLICPDKQSRYATQF